MQIRFRVIFAVLGLAGLFVYLLFGSGDDRQLPDGIVVGNGRIEAVQVDIASKIPGRVDAVLVQEGGGHKRTFGGSSSRVRKVDKADIGDMRPGSR